MSLELEGRRGGKQQQQTNKKMKNNQTNPLQTSKQEPPKQIQKIKQINRKQQKTPKQKPHQKSHTSFSVDKYLSHLAAPTEVTLNLDSPTSLINIVL